MNVSGGSFISKHIERLYYIAYCSPSKHSKELYSLEQDVVTLIGQLKQVVDTNDLIEVEILTEKIRGKIYKCNKELRSL